MVEVRVNSSRIRVGLVFVPRIKVLLRNPSTEENSFNNLLFVFAKMLYLNCDVSLDR